jgi:hypothetical protein
MQGDDLVAYDIVSRRKIGNGEIPGEVVVHEVVRYPFLYIFT